MKLSTLMSRVTNYVCKDERAVELLQRFSIIGHKEPYTNFICVADGSDWVLSWEAAEIASLTLKMGIPVKTGIYRCLLKQQCVFYTNQFELTQESWKIGNHRNAFAYFHGLPGTEPQFTRVYEAIRKNHEMIHRLQVSHTQMREVALDTGIDSSKVFLIPIAINLGFFSPQTKESRNAVRKKLGIPEHSIVIGSFQKDGVGWGEGMEPKLIKGPDIFVKAIEILSASIKDLHVLLTGPARGFVKAGLEHLGVPFTHYYLKDYPEIGEMFHAIDAYIVSSRQEGGPKAVLESMASGVPLITTRVGQAMDLVYHGKNGWMVEPENAEGLAYWTMTALTQVEQTKMIVREGLKTARMNTYDAQLPLWKGFMRGFVDSNTI